jgi:hypothetical protein
VRNSEAAFLNADRLSSVQLNSDLIFISLSLSRLNARDRCDPTRIVPIGLRPQPWELEARLRYSRVVQDPQTGARIGQLRCDELKATLGARTEPDLACRAGMPPVVCGRGERPERTTLKRRRQYSAAFD